MSALNLDPNNMPETHIIAAALKEFIDNLPKFEKIVFDVIKVQKAIFDGKETVFKTSFIPDEAELINAPFFSLYCEVGLSRGDILTFELFTSVDENILSTMQSQLTDAIVDKDSNVIVMDGPAVLPFNSDVIKLITRILVNENTGNTVVRTEQDAVDGDITRVKHFLSPTNVHSEFFCSVDEFKADEVVGEAMVDYENEESFGRLISRGTKKINFRLPRSIVQDVFEDIVFTQDLSKMGNSKAVAGDVFAISVCGNAITLILDASLLEAAVDGILETIRGVVDNNMGRYNEEGPCPCCNPFKGPISIKSE